MAYSLTVTNVPGRAPEFAFNTEEAKLGRTADNDIVVKDPNASRAHCRVFPKDGRFWVEDLKSANGTTVNGVLIQGKTIELKHGDTLSIGEVTFAFAILAKPSAEVPKYDFDYGDTVVRGGYGAKATDPEAKLVQTSLSPAFDPVQAVRERERSTSRAAAKKPPPPSAADTDELDRDSGPKHLIHAQVDATDPIQAAVPASTQANTTEVPAPPPALAPPRAPAPPAAPAPTAAVLPVAQPADADRARVRRGKDRPPEEDSELFEPTAADKARIRRQAHKTLGGRLVYAFDQLPRPAKAGVVVVMLGLCGGLGAGIYLLTAPPPKRFLPPEPPDLANLGTIEQSFGKGDDVDYERTDLKTFGFKAVSPTRVVGLLHYQARDVGKDEVSISLNEQDLGFVPPDVVNNAERQLEVVLPANHIKRGEVNHLTFDNVKNPPGREDWAIWNLSLQLLPLPELSAAETPAAVKEDLDRAQKFYDLREVGPQDLFNAWKAYRDAWLKLESMPGRPQDLYAIARGQQAETWRLLDFRCKRMQVDVRRALTKQVPDYATARVVLRDMLRYFPTREHPCHGLVQSQLDELAQ